MLYATQPRTVESMTATSPETHGLLETHLRAALEHARRLTAMYGTGNLEVVMAWETYEELLTAQAHRAESAAPSSSSFASYCSLNPDAPECRLYNL
ncbi:MAG: CP12 domain-containing protein [Nodosilinea sp.]